MSDTLQTGETFQIPYPLPAGQMIIIVGDSSVLLECDKLPAIEVDSEGTVLPGDEFDQFVTRSLLPAIVALGAVEKQADEK